MDSNKQWIDPLEVPIDEYQSSIKARSSYGNGTRANPIDWIDHRTVECLSQGEKMVYLYLRWDDDVTEIRTQVAMNNDVVKKIAADFNFPYPGHNLTTDFVVTYKNGSKRAYSVKNSIKDLNTESEEGERVIRRQIIEAVYWEKQGISWELILKERLNQNKINNIRIVTRFYEPDTVWDKKSLIAYFIARKIIDVDMNQPINFPELIKKYIDEDGLNP